MTGAVPPSLAARVRAWIEEDPQPATRAELTALLGAGDVAALEERFAEPLAFGTAGLRGELGAGPARMNRLVVRRTSAGVARWLLARGGEAARAGLVVGCDARHGSFEFADDVVEVVAAMGVAVHVLPRALPTPLTAFAVLHLGAAAGVMVTASHNPATDNGYKVYAADGAQVVPPDDALIAAAAAAAPPPVPGSPPGGPGLVREVGSEPLLHAYAETVLAVLEPRSSRRLTTVYTPVHGVGGAVLPWLMQRAGFAAPQPVAAQAEPDPDFPTAAFPNPEEPGVLDLALAEASRRGADLVIANDPDADRLAVAVPVAAGDGAGQLAGTKDPARGGSAGRDAAGPSTVGGGWRVLSGDEVGALLGDHLIRRRAARVGRDGAVPVVATSIVSSSLLAKIAAAAGVTFAETLTGFKWIARAADKVPGGRLLFGYEEALGYAVCPAVRDKDGLSAALLVAELCAATRAAGRSLAELLDDLHERFGVHLTSQWSLRLSGPDAHERLVAVVERWRHRPPERLGGLEVREVVDLERPRPDLPPTTGVLLRLVAADGGDGVRAPMSARVVVRPSGTEPKLKAYLEVVTAPAARAPAPGGEGASAGLAAARTAAAVVMVSLRDDVAAALGP
jgi:phosphomannomutase